MPQLISQPTVIPVPGGKTIEEFIGQVNSKDTAVSVAVMDAPAGWSEPAQTPQFDEFTLVLSGSIDVEHDGGLTNVSAGQAIITRAGERVRYLTKEDTKYVAICLPAFSPELVNREED
jgi:mannose-6-phosphate isomerase-like protein (cupin superfamily)